MPRPPASISPSRGALAPWVALVFIAGALGVVPYGMPISMGYAAPLALIGIVSILLARVDPQGRWQAVTIWPPLVVLAAYAISSSLSEYPKLSIERSVSMPLFAIVFVAVQVAGWNPRALRGVLWVSAAAVVAIAADVLIERVSGTPLFAAESEVIAGRLSGSQGNPNDLAAASILLPLGLAALPRRRLAAWYGLLAVIGAIPWVMSASRQALVGWLVAVSVPMKGRLKRRTALIAGGVVAVVLITIVAAVPTLRERVATTWNNGFGIRESIAAFGCSLVAEHPITGIGPGVFGEYYLAAALQEWSWRGAPLKQIGMPWVHSVPLEVAAEFGVVGIAAFGAVVIGGFGQLRRGLKSDAATARLATAVLAALLAGLVMGLVDLSFIKDWVRCVFWLVLGLAFVVGDHAKADKGPTFKRTDTESA